MIEIHKSIAYYLGEGRTTLILSSEKEKMLAAIEVLALMAEHYEICPMVHPATVRRWRDTYLAIFDEEYNINPSEQPIGWRYERREVILKVFEHLERVAHLMPPPRWSLVVED
jgi:hypothetical protein